MGLYLFVQRVEDREDAFPGMQIRNVDRGREPFLELETFSLDVRRDEVVLRGEQPVEGRRGDAGLDRDFVYAGGPDPVPVEQVPRDLQDVLPGLGPLAVDANPLPWSAGPPL